MSLADPNCRSALLVLSDGHPDIQRRLAALFVILFVSLLASALPSISTRYPRLRIHPTIFFILKHFGTGVILSTAFVHLLQDAFESLSHPCVDRRWRKRTGAIVMTSLLSIFLVEYLSTVYVDRLTSPNPSSDNQHEHGTIEDPIEPYRDDPDLQDPSPSVSPSRLPSPILEPPSDDENSDTLHEISTGTGLVHIHAHSHSNSIDSNSKAYIQGHHRHERKHEHRPGARSSEYESTSDRRQVVGLLVLQVGIMLHSVIIGITLAVSNEFTSLIVAVIFHQLFEGLSLGIRISILPRTRPILPITLCILFALCTPLGVLVGLFAFPSGARGTPDEAEQVAAQIVQGMMTSISAGLLIYAATVEMLAGDFVMDKEMRKSGMRKQAIALISLILGAVAMSVIGV